MLSAPLGWLGGSETCFKLAGIASHITNNFLLSFFSVSIFILGHWFSREILSKYELSHSFRNQFLKKRLGLRRPGHRFSCFVSCLTLFSLVILTYNVKRHEKTNAFHNLECHQKQEFFTNECLSTIDEIRAESLKQYLSASALIQLKCKNHGLFFRFLLLLSSDIHLHPGPTYSPCSLCNKSVRKGLPCNQCGLWVHKRCDKISDGLGRRAIFLEDGG